MKQIKEITAIYKERRKETHKNQNTESKKTRKPPKPGIEKERTQ